MTSVEAIEGLDAESPEHALDLLSLVESVLEDPTVVIRRQVDRIKTELINRLKAEGVSYDERMNRLDEEGPRALVRTRDPVNRFPYGTRATILQAERGARSGSVLT